MKVGDIVALVSFGEPIKPVKIIAETKKYFRVSLKNLPKSHPSRFDLKNWDKINHTLDTKLFTKHAGIEKGCSNSLKYCPDYITVLNDNIINSLKKDIAEYKNCRQMKDFVEETEKALIECENAIKEGII